MTIEQAIEHAEEVATEQERLMGRYDAASGYARSGNEAIRTESAKKCEKCAAEHRQLAAWLRKLQGIITCCECDYYDPPHVENNGVRYEYTELPADAFDALGTGLVTAEYGINVGGRCTRDYNAGYDDDKRVYVPENNFCGRAERRTE